MTAKEYFLNTPIYRKTFIDSEEGLDIIIDKAYSQPFHGYNPVDKIETTFSTSHQSFSSIRYLETDVAILKHEFICVRTRTKFYFFSHWDGETKQLTKIGQYPSLADFQIVQIKQFDKVISKGQLKELTKAIGLAANGVGIGSFVYLRRIFEALVYEAAVAKETESGLDREQFRKLRMGEKITFLGNYLPDFLVEHKDIYSILSIGIHELTEEVCLENFDIVRIGIEMILEEKLEKFNKAKRVKEASDKIKAASENIRKKEIQ